MKKVLLGLAVLPFLAGVSLAGQPQALTDQQMDKVSAGFDFTEADVNNVGVTVTSVNEPGVINCGSGCFLSIQGTKWGTSFGQTGVQSFQLLSGFGP